MTKQHVNSTDFLFRVKPQVKSFYGHDKALLHARVWTLLARSSGSLNHSYLLHLNQNHENSISHDRSKWGENGSVTTTTQSSILPVPVTCNSSGDTPLHTFSSSQTSIFWNVRHAGWQKLFDVRQNICHILQSTISTRLNGVTVQNILSFADTAMKS